MPTKDIRDCGNATNLQFQLVLKKLIKVSNYESAKCVTLSLLVVIYKTKCQTKTNNYKCKELTNSLRTENVQLTEFRMTTSNSLQSTQTE